MYRISHPTLFSAFLVGLVISLFGLLFLLSPANQGGSGVFALGSMNTAYARDCTGESLYTAADCGETIINQCVGDACTSGIATTELKGVLKNKVATSGTFTDYIQSIVVYLLGFVALICVLLIIYQGGKIMISGGNEETVKTAKKTIIYAFLGVILIFLAYSITIFVIGDKDGKGGIIQAGATSFRSSFEQKIDSVFGIETAQALQDAEIDEVISETFDEYSMYRFKRIMTKIFLEQNGAGVSSSTVQELNNLIDQSSLTLPDKSKTANDAKIAKIKVGLAKVLANPKSKDEASGLEGLIQGFSTSVEIGRISGEIGSSATSGNAPLTVTFRANNVADPSGKKIPDGNYVWWIKGPRNEKIVIGRGVSFLYSFPLEKIYTVFLDVTSDSKNVHGKTDVLPLRIRTDINVLPRLANVSFYLNGTNVTNLNELKVTPGQARNGLVIDATASTSKDGAKFISTDWDFGNGRSTSYQGGPRLERQIYAREGDYNISLAVKNNSNEITRKTITLKVRDPIASIVASKTSGSLQDDFRFTTTTANSRLNLAYDWIITDNRDNRDIARVKGGTLNYRFKKVGEYTIKLNANTIDNKIDTDFIVVTIDPRPPVVNFQLSKFSSEQPNVLRLNATQSIDPDTNSADQLKYRWKIDGQPRELADTQRNGAIGVYKLSELGEHTVDLEVISPNGLSTTTTKKITIDSLLGADLKVAQKIVRVGDPMLFVANAPEAKIFVWNFGDGVTTNPVTDSKMTHVYNKSGIYTVRLTIRADNTGIANTISRVVYVGDSDTPVPLISISQGGEAVTPEVGVCGVGKEGYTISRLSSIDISARDSLNIDGTTQNLSYSWKANGKTSSLQTFPHSFDELGCFPIRLSVRSNQSGASAAREIWVRVDNIPPTLSGLSVTSADTTKDPVIVNVNAINAQDPDGVITSYIWSYWTKTDSEPQGLRVTRTPQTTFVLPRIDDTYYFGVILEDSNGVKSKSIDLLSQDASITLQSDNSNTPLITLKSSLAAPANTVVAGKQVTFITSTTNLLDDNITNKTVFKWDFDGDGFYDKNATGSTATYTYQKPGIYRAKVKALYKGVSNTRTITITVTNDLKPSFDYIAIGRMIVLVNSTRGVYNSVTWELPDGATSNELDSITIVLPEGQSQTPITMRVSDGDKEAAATDTVTIDTRNIKTATSSNGTILLSQPRAINNSITIDSVDEKVTLYISSQGSVAKYAIDDNLNMDSNLNGDASDDEDNRNSPTYRNGGVYVVKGFNDRDASRTVRVTFYDANNQKIDTKEIIIKSSFVSAVDTIPEPSQEIAEIREQDRANLDLLREMIQSQVPEASRATFMSYFGKLKDEWYDQNQKTTTIIEFEKAIASAGLDEKLVTDMNGILESFLATDDALGVEVSTALNTIRGLIPTSSSYAEEVMGKDGNGGLLKEIIDAPNNLEENKVKALKILSYVKDDSQITVENKNILKSQLKIVIYHGSENIPDSEVEPPSETPPESSSGGFMGTIILIGQVIGILIGFAIGLVLLLLIFFKITNKNDAIGFQDWIIEKLFQHGHDDTASSSVPAKPIVSSSKPVHPNIEAISSKSPSTPDTSALTSIATNTDPLVQVASSSVAPVAPASSEALPPWLKNAVEFNSSSTPTSSNSVDPLASTSVIPEVVTPEVVVSNTPPEIPDWLKSISTPPVTKTITPSSVVAENDPETALPNESALPQVSSVGAPSSELPSWLMGTNDTPTLPDLPPLPELPQTEPREDIAVSPAVADISDDHTEVTSPQELSPETPIISSEMPAWLQDDTLAPKSENLTEKSSKQETSSFRLSPMDVSLGDTSSVLSDSQTLLDQKTSEDTVSETTDTSEVIDTTATDVKPRKPRRKSKVQLQEEQGESSSDFSTHASDQVVTDTTPPTANAAVPNSDLPEWLRS